MKTDQQAASMIDLVSSPLRDQAARFWHRDNMKYAKVRALALATFATLLFAVCSTEVRGGDLLDEYELEMYREPDIEITVPKIEFAERLLPLWLEALQRPDAEVRRLACKTILIAQQREMEGLQAAKPHLIAILKEKPQDVSLVRAAASALIGLDARDQDALLADAASQHGEVIARLVEPTLAGWKSDSMQATWLERVRSASQHHSGGEPTSQSLLISAIDGLKEVADADAVEPLTTILVDSLQPAAARYASADALGTIQSEGLVALASDFATGKGLDAPMGQLIAVSLLKTHRDSAAIELLHRMVDQGSPVVQSAALDCLFESDAKQIDQHIDVLVKSRDANVRGWCARSMLTTKDPQRIDLLSTMLDDVNGGLRRTVADGLVELAQESDLKERVIDAAVAVLALDSWRGCEQAAGVLVSLDHKAAGERLVELLGHPRGEVQVASAWGLRKLQRKDLLTDMLEHAEAVYGRFQSGQFDDETPGPSDQMAQLFMCFGEQQYGDAEPLMRKYIPRKFELGAHSRPAAVWALGWLHEGDPQEDLVKLLLERLDDVQQSTTETDQVRQMCTVSLVRMNATESVEHFRDYAIEIRGDLGSRMCYWGIEQFTGEDPPPLPKLPAPYQDWFLAPLDQ